MPEFMHPTWLHCVRICLQLQIVVPTPQISLPPSCLAWSVCCATAGVMVSGKVASNRMTKTAAYWRTLVMALSQCNRRGKSMRQWLRGRLLGAREHQHGTAIRQHRHQRSKDHHRSPQPDPLH